MEKSGDDKLLPMTLEKAWRSKNIPLFLRGDGVEFQSRESLLTFSFRALALGKAMTSGSCCHGPSQPLEKAPRGR